MGMNIGMFGMLSPSVVMVEPGVILIMRFSSCRLTGVSPMLCIVCHFERMAALVAGGPRNAPQLCGEAERSWRSALVICVAKVS